MHQIEELFKLPVGLMGLENDIPDTPTARQTTITLTNAVRMINLVNAKV